jgi:hypothetical protein
MGSFVAGLLLVPVCLGLIGSLAFLTMQGYIPKPNFPLFFAGEVGSLAIFVVIVLMATSRMSK